MVGGNWTIIDLKSLTLEFRTNVFDWFVWVEKGVHDEDVLEEIIDYIEDRGYLIIFAFTRSFASSIFRTMINLITFITNGLLIFSIIIAMIGLTLHSLLTTMARRREIGMLRSIGLDKKGVIRSISGGNIDFISSRYLYRYIRRFSSRLFNGGCYALRGIPHSYLDDSMVNYWYFDINCFNHCNSELTISCKMGSKLEYY